MKRLLIAAFATLAFTATPGAQQLPAAANQTANIKRTPLQKFDVPGANYETVIGLAEIAPNANIGRHTHPGIEGGYLIEGGMTLMVEGQPPKEIKPGDSWQIPPGTIHDDRAHAIDGAAEGHRVAPGRNRGAGGVPCVLRAGFAAGARRGRRVNGTGERHYRCGSSYPTPAVRGSALR